MTVTPTQHTDLPRLAHSRTEIASADDAAALIAKNGRELLGLT